ncbi:TIGR03862 family flavoprotein [Brucella sp. RRSP16]|nr:MULTISPECIES: TIGR03862 family flavoprotein [Brucella]ERI16482.1 NAD(FAD)-utilizing dehydrogenase [Ochrobactrum sp. EGD-AQ16]KAB2697150.1 TIGR03862 family flavoprotein [Brucella intermedia]KAB2712424.1 TIGR03862 family flavoprotein [Brucella intermedia]MCH6205096.1 TIGR03862 family flavoprotein [Brucella ciceri]MDH0122965.1 TIGR03862 family flavoprotein [Brucella intermedia GD04153]
MKGNIAIIGGGPSGLMAAERLSALGHRVTVYEQMPTVGRKFLLAGKSGLNITHSEDFTAFAKRFGSSSELFLPALTAFGPIQLRKWADELGADTFVGSSGRVFPKAMKASPLLRAWVKRLENQGVRILTRHRWLGFEGKGLRIEKPDGVEVITCNAALFAFGGGSWPKLGSNGAWIDEFRRKAIDMAPFRSANCGFDVVWSDFFAQRFAGEPVKSVTVTSDAGTTQGEFVITRGGVEGSLIYAHSAALRDSLEENAQTFLTLDLAPGRTVERLESDIARQDAKLSFGNLLRKAAGLTGVKAALVTEFTRDRSPKALASTIKALSIPLIRPRPLEEAISSAGGIRWHEIDGHYMLPKLPGVFVAGEMIDWEAPTGGYLLTACFAMGRAAADGIDAWIKAGNALDAR